MKILVTGGAGFIGSHIVDNYLKAGHKVVVADNLSTGKKENINPQAKFYLLDINNKEKVQKIFQQEKPDILNHHAAQKNVRTSVKNPILDAKINILGSINLIESARKNKIKKVIFASSGGAIYGDTENIPTLENEKEQPVSPYGVAKLSFEKYLHYYFIQYKIPYLALRYANVYGPRQDPKGEAGVVAIFCQNLINKKPSKIFGDGKQTRDFVYVKDVAQANLKALKNNFTGAINIGSGREIDINNLYQLLAEIINSQLAPAQHFSALPGEQRQSCLDINKAKKILKWQPKINLKQGLAQTAKSYSTAILKK